MKVTNEEVIRKILGFMQMLSKQKVPDIKIVFEDDKNVLIQDFSRKFVVRSHKLTWDEFVTTDSKILIEIARGLQNDK